ncbi:ndufa8 [Umbelopsis nana]
MTATRDPTFTSTKFVDPTPAPKSVPPVEEIGLTSAPLKSAAFFIGEYCKDYNADFMLCKNENNDPEHCLKEGRKVTRCALDLIKKLRENCDAEFEKHWKCLDVKNQDYYQCRKEERQFNSCVFEKLGLQKKIPGSPEGQPQIHEKPSPIITSHQK